MYCHLRLPRDFRLALVLVCSFRFFHLLKQKVTSSDVYVNKNSNNNDNNVN